MPHVFRLYTTGSANLQGWQQTPGFPYNSGAREEIADPDGATAKHEITSIPSPLARIALVKTAFAEVCRRAKTDLRELDGQTIFHKMVSDSLDVGEIFFNIRKFEGQVGIITWRPQAELEALATDGDPDHKTVADALLTYLKADGQTYNFWPGQNIYLLNYLHGPDKVNIIGATSPATLFFSNADKLDYVHGICFANGDLPFDSAYQPLYKRDADYVKSLWAYRLNTPLSASLMPEVDEYLNLTYRAAGTDLRDELRQMQATAAADFQPITAASGSQANTVDVLGQPLLSRKPVASAATDFDLRPSRPGAAGQMPKVLPVEAGNTYSQFRYVAGLWGAAAKAPYKDDKPLDSRRLPCDGSQLPYLTISDFLEERLITVPHALNKQWYAGSDFKKSGQNTPDTPLPPVKPLYFKYFTPKDLAASLTIETLAGGAYRVRLAIPVSGRDSVRKVDYSRTYYSGQEPEITADKNDGAITRADFTGFIMPCVRFDIPEEAIYTAALVSTCEDKTRLEFFEAGEPLAGVATDCRNTTGEDPYKSTTYTVEGRLFDCVRVVCAGGEAGFLLPKFKKAGKTKQYDVAIDLGTSNTHIEYREHTGATSVPLDIQCGAEPVLCPFFEPTVARDGNDDIQLDLIDECALTEADYLPAKVGHGSDFAFPTRTALAFAADTDWTKLQRPFGLANAALAFDKRRQRLYCDPKPKVNIKWDNSPEAQAAARAYIACLMMTVRSKVAAMGGSVSRTSLTWLYPDSMSAFKLSLFRNAWAEAYHKYFNPKGQPLDVSESEAPIRYHFQQNATTTRLINIDIGGGTTDIAFSDNGVVTKTASFRFAANALFEDSLAPGNRTNGIVDHYKGQLLDTLRSGSMTGELQELYRRHMASPANMAQFLFSLKDNSKVSDISPAQIDFCAVLQADTRFKAVFMLFYTSIIYHTAQLIKAYGMKLPRHIAFSGNGSRVVKILSADTAVLGRYTRKVIELVLGQDYGGQLDLLGLGGETNPKESTAKGALLPAPASAQTIDRRNLLGADAGTLATDTDTYRTLAPERRQEIVGGVRRFFQLALVDLPKLFDLKSAFGLDNAVLKTAGVLAASKERMKSPQESRRTPIKRRRSPKYQSRPCRKSFTPGPIRARRFLRQQKASLRAVPFA